MCITFDPETPGNPGGPGGPIPPGGPEGPDNPSTPLNPCRYNATVTYVIDGYCRAYKFKCRK